MAKRLLFILSVLVILLAFPVGKVSAGSLTIRGTLVPGGPTMTVVIISTPNCVSLGAIPVLYRAHPFFVDVAGTYTFTDSDTDNNPAMYLFADSFNPAAPLVNCVAATNTGSPASFSYSLDPLRPYILVVIEDSFAQDGVSYQASISGPGNPILGSPLGGCGLEIPAGSVVGEAPLGAQAYYEPGSTASGVVLNPGTYWVIGQDKSETYYKIVLACQYLWVRKDTMQPSFQSPQNGTPLPTRVVD